MHTNKTDLYFFEELKCAIGEEQSFQWLMSETKKALSLSANRSPRSSPPNSPRLGQGHSEPSPNRKHSMPEAGAFWRNRNSICKSEIIQASKMSGQDATIRTSSSSNSLSTSSSSSDHFSRSFHGLDVQQLSNLMTGDTKSGSKMGLLFTDAAHSVLESA